jgi:phosphohistidine phosphatase
MKVFLVRHAEAVEAELFDGSDEDRPLTAEGRRTARETGRWLRRYAGTPDRIFSSRARRAVETARRIAKVCGTAEPEIRSELNPGCTAAAFGRFLKGIRGKRIVVVGHEPDISRAVAALVGRGGLRLKVGKGAAVELEVDERKGVSLRALVPPDAM